jgi:tetratricopeptide (TPR) repeat protein
LGQAKRALPLAERALAIAKATRGPDHRDVATDLNNLALVLLDLGQADEALPLAERALALTTAAQGPDHLYSATIRNNLAEIVRRTRQISDS